MTVIVKSAKTHSAAKKFCGGEEPAICPGDIHPHQQYLSYYYPNFDQNFWSQFWGDLIFVHHIFLFLPNFF